MRWRRILYDAVGVVMIWFVALATLPQGSESPADEVRGTITQVLSIFEDPAKHLPGRLMKEGRWHAYDIIVDGVSLVKNYWSHFQKIVGGSSYLELAVKLQGC